MTISIWRYSHLALAVSSFLFILLASLTGIVLAFEPVSQKVKPYASKQFHSLALSEAIPNLKKAYPGIVDLQVDANNFVSVKAIDESGKKLEEYVDPATGKSFSSVEKKSVFFEWMTTLHRSLFLHELGRIFIGINAFLLFLIALSGTLLLVHRQRGLSHFFKKIVKESPLQYFHVVTGRLALIPILIISLSGVYLSLERFELISSEKIKHEVNYDKIETEPVIPLNEFPVFKNTLLSEVQSIEFPFSDDAEDFFTLKLKNKELVVNQFTGQILSNVPYKTTTLLKDLSLDLHTGRASWIWAMVLALASVNILYFIYSGFSMTLKRSKNKIRNKFVKEDAEIIILVGSENGSTFHFANALHRHLIKNGQKSFLTELNQYTSFSKAKHLIVVTATYGIGNPPVNASHFIKLLRDTPQNHPVNFSVLGFGSHAYPDFCKFAFEVHDLLLQQPWATPLIDVHAVNDKSPEEFLKWCDVLLQKGGVEEKLSPVLLKAAPQRSQVFTVTKKINGLEGSPTFLLSLKPLGRIKFTSGDLLAIYPAHDHRERLYSIGRLKNEIQLSVRLHEGGLGSGYLDAIKEGQTLEARIVRNDDFHFPEKSPAVIMICNGTGIAPFLGMIDQNSKQTHCYLYAGFRGQSSFSLYKDQLYKNVEDQKLNALKIAYSREQEKYYVKDLLLEDSEFVAATLNKGGHLMICGSLAMEQNVMELLEKICVSKNAKTLAFYQGRGQILSDCY